MLQTIHPSSRTGRAFARGLAAAFALAGGLGATTSAFAANADIEVKVTAVPQSVSVKRVGLTTYAAYRVCVQSKTTNVINAAVFTATTNITAPTVSGDSAPYEEAVANAGIATACEGDTDFVEVPSTSPGAAANCAVDTTTGGIRCPIGRLSGIASNTGSKSAFVVIFKAPASGNPLTLNWKFTYSTTGSAGSHSSNVQSFGDFADTALTTTTDDAKRDGFISYFPTFGGTFFTAAAQANAAGAVGGVATIATPWTSTVVIPGGNTPNTITVTQPDALQSCAANVLKCFQTDLKIPDQQFASEFSVILRRDASTIKSGAKIATGVISYTHIIGGTLIPLNDCAITAGPHPGVPCIQTRTEYTRKNAPTPDFIGDWEFIIRAVDNGSFAG